MEAKTQTEKFAKSEIGEALVEKDETSQIRAEVSSMRNRVQELEASNERLQFEVRRMSEKDDPVSEVEFTVWKLQKQEDERKVKEQIEELDRKMRQFHEKIGAIEDLQRKFKGFDKEMRKNQNNIEEIAEENKKKTEDLQNLTGTHEAKIEVLKNSTGQNRDLLQDFAKRLGDFVEKNVTLEDLDRKIGDLAEKISATQEKNVTFEDLPMELKWQEYENKWDGVSRVTISKKDVDVFGLPFLQKALSMTRIGKLSFKHCGLTAEGAKISAQAFSANGNIKELSFWTNEIGDDGVAILAQALETNTTLKEIWLGGNSITNDGAVAVARAFKTNQILEHIGLDANKIHDDGAVEIAKAIEANTGLKLVSIQHNQFGTVGRNALAQAQATRKAQGKPIDIKT